MKIQRINKRAILKVLIDGIIWSLITFFAFYLRLDIGVFEYLDDIFKVSLIIIPFKFLIIILNDHYKLSWRYSTFMDFRKPAMSILYLTIIYYLMIIVSYGEILIPRTVPTIDAALTLIAFLLIRMAAQITNRRKNSKVNNNSDKKMIIVAGAGDSGTMIAKEMLRHPEMNMQPIGFLDDDPNKSNQRIAGIPVLGEISDLETIIFNNHVDEIIIAMPSESGDIVRKILKITNEANIHCRTIPGLFEIISGVVSINQLREVQVDDLLRRKPVNLNTDNIKAYIKDKRVLVTGAGGSIGSEIVRQICSFVPKRVVLLGRGENSIHEIFKEISRVYQHIEVIPVITDVRDRVSLKAVFDKYQPEVVFHAAAHKHVYLMESNPSQAILNNVIGTKNLVDLSLNTNIQTFVNISTDKAINPTSVMGASKRVAELIVEDASKKTTNSQKYVSVRFGNVLGSRGSVIPIFKEQIQRGGPITVTHPDMKRYFMTIPEASQLVLQAGALNMNGAVFVLDMGEPVKIVDMARDLIRLSGLEPDVDIQIKFTGIKPGEKLFEELLNTEEGTNMTQHKNIFVAKKNAKLKNIDIMIKEMIEVAQNCDSVSIKKILKKVVPSYSGLNK